VGERSRRVVRGANSHPLAAAVWSMESRTWGAFEARVPGMQGAGVRSLASHIEDRASDGFWRFISP